MQGIVEFITVRPGNRRPPEPRQSVTAIAGRGLAGDQYAARARLDADRQLTLIEAETLAWLDEETGIHLGPEETKRNLTTRGIRLNDLVGRRFRIGEVLCEGTDLCQPCTHLEQCTGKPVRLSLLNRGGLSARILSGGTIRLGDPVVPEPALVVERIG